jgi:hypothetical protein
MSKHCKVIAGRQSAWTSPDDHDSFAAEHTGFSETPVFSDRHVAEESFDRMDAYGAVK